MPKFNEYIFTPQIIKRICVDVRGGVPPATAAMCAGVNKSTFILYMKNAEKVLREDAPIEDLEKNNKKLVEFYNKVSKAESDYKKFLYSKEYELVNDNNPAVLMNALKCRTETHNPANINQNQNQNLNTEVPLSDTDTAEIIDKIKSNVGIE